MAGTPTKSPKKEKLAVNGKEQKDLLPNGRDPGTWGEEEEGVEVGEEEFNPPDGGWGWVVCIASFWTNGTVFGILNTFGILYVKMIEIFDNGDEDIAFKTSWVGALQISMTFFLSPLASILVDRFGIRITACCGAILATAGMIASSFVSTLEILYLTYGLLLGIGSSIIYNPSLVILGHYFKRHLGVVNGLVSFGSAVFTIVLPFMLKGLLNSVGLRNTMRVLAVFLALLIPFSLTWKPLFDSKHRELDHYLSTDSVKKKVSGCCKFSSKFLNTAIWKIKGYRVWALSVPVAFLGYFIPFVHLVKHTNDVFPEANGEVLVMCIGATSGISRLIFGKIADLPNINRIRMQQTSFLLLGIATACIPFANHFGVLIFLTLVMGISDGCFICLIGPIAFDLLGPAGAAQGIGCMLGIASFPMTAGPPLAGLAYDYMGSYKLVFFAAGAPPLLAAILMFLIPTQEKTQTHAVTMTETFVALSRTDLDQVGIDSNSMWSVAKLRRSHLDMRGARSVGTLHAGGLNYTPQMTDRKALSVPHLPDSLTVPEKIHPTDSLTEAEYPIDTTILSSSVA